MWTCITSRKINMSYLICIFFSPSDLPAAAVVNCGKELRQVGDELYWRYRLLEILIRNYKNVTKVKWDVMWKYKWRSWIFFSKPGIHSQSRRVLDTDSPLVAKWWLSSWITLVRTPWWRCWMWTVSGLDCCHIHNWSSTEKRPNMRDVFDLPVQTHGWLETKVEHLIGSFLLKDDNLSHMSCTYFFICGHLCICYAL